MPSNDHIPHDFGCSHCYGEDARAAYELQRTLVAVLVDESHFSVTLCECPHCHQRFVSFFTEFVDWQDGDDPQYRDILPLTRQEADEIEPQGRKVDLEYLAVLGCHRRYLKMNAPKGCEPEYFWSPGGLTVYHSRG